MRRDNPATVRREGPQAEPGQSYGPSRLTASERSARMPRAAHEPTRERLPAWRKPFTGFRPTIVVISARRRSVRPRPMHVTYTFEPHSDGTAAPHPRPRRRGRASSVSPPRSWPARSAPTRQLRQGPARPRSQARRTGVSPGMRCRAGLEGAGSATSTAGSARRPVISPVVPAARSCDHSGSRKTQDAEKQNGKTGPRQHPHHRAAESERHTGGRKRTYGCAPGEGTEHEATPAKRGAGAPRRTVPTHGGSATPDRATALSGVASSDATQRPGGTPGRRTAVAAFPLHRGDALHAGLGEGG